MKKLLTFSLLSGLLFSCTEKIKLDLASLEEPFLIVDATIDDRPKADTIILNYSSNYYAGGLPEAEIAAQVTISFNDSSYAFVHLDEKPGYYISPSNFAPRANNNYILEIEARGKRYRGETYMHPVHTIDSVGQRRIDGDKTIGGGEIELTISFQDPPGVRNYYLYRESVNDTFYFESLFEYGSIFDDFIIDGQYADLIPYGLFDYRKGDTIEIFAHSMDKIAYDIYTALLTESEFKGGFFDAPSNNVPSNITGGAKGLFVAHAINSRKIVIAD